MKGSDKAIVLGVVMAVVLLGFYLKVLSPKREKASSLQKDITELQANVDQQRQAAAFGEDARQHFPTYYGRLVVMGKAVPSDADSASLLVELDAIAHRTSVKFDGLELSAGSGADTSSTSTSTPPSTSGSTGTSTTTTGTTSTTSTTASPTPATTTPTAATEVSAANVPLGAAVGTAGLPTMPYNLNFVGRYFDVANFLKGVDDLVHTHGADQVSADGRLLTIDGFSLKVPDSSTAATPDLQVSLAVTSYVTPSDQGLTAGASPAGPAPSLSQPQTQPTSATVSP